MERWRIIEGHTNYEVSDLGNVRSIDRYIPDSWGRLFLRKGKILKNSIGVRGYVIVGLSCPNNGIRKVKYSKVHRLVAEAFIPNPDNKETVNHINGIKTDNRVENLEWATIQENAKHARDIGLIQPNPNTVFALSPPKGELNVKAKLTEADILGIRELFKSKITLKNIASKYNVSQGCIERIKYGHGWTHVK